jgi:beta-glucosidase
MKMTVRHNFPLFVSGGIKVLPALVLALTFAGAALAKAQAPAPDSPAIEAKAQAMLSKMTLEQKIKLLGGVDSMFTQAEPAINLPRFKMSDASVGIRTWGPTMAYAGGVGLAATWDRDFARSLGEAIGRDARARNVNFLLGPGVNIARSPVNGRNFEYLSEDPFLNAEMVVPYIEGVQSQGVIATVKHYALNNSEFDRHNIDAQIDERTLREIYLPAFEAAVKKAHVDSVMNSYNLVNGVHATQNEFLNLKVLKGEWEFKGILMSDWVATYDGVAAANNGLDLEMPSAAFMTEKTLAQAVKDGKVKESTIDDKILRLLRTELRYGFTDRPQFAPSYATYSMKGREVALEGARESLTLLKNQGNILPLDPAKVKTIAVIGPNAWPAIVGGGGSALPTPISSVSTLEGIGNLLGSKVSLLYSRGVTDLPDIFRTTRWDGGVKAETYANRELNGAPSTATQRNVSDWKYSQWGPEGDPRAIRYSAKFKAEKAGKYVLIAASSGDDVYRVQVDEKPALTQADEEAESPQMLNLNLTAGQTVNVVAEYLPHSPGLSFGLGVINADDMISAEAKDYAAKADAVVVAVGFNPTTEGEGKDRSFDLPWGQDELVNAIVAANPKTIVVLTNGGSLNLTRWIDKVPALVDSWYPGQEGGTAIAEALFGKLNPEGRLPISWDRTWEENPSYKWYFGDPSKDEPMQSTWSDGKMKTLKIRHAEYGDKLMVGYRYWTTTGKHALYPFGYGLGYSTFKFDKMKAPATAASGSTVAVRFDVTNTGKMEGAEVAQVYVSDPSTKVERPERELKGFEKVRLAPGETKHVTVNLDARAFSYWDEATHNWKIDAGKFVVRVGDSSENTPLTAEVNVQ